MTGTIRQNLIRIRISSAN